MDCGKGFQEDGADPGSEDPNMPTLTLTKPFGQERGTSASSPLRRTSSLGWKAEKKNEAKR